MTPCGPCEALQKQGEILKSQEQVWPTSLPVGCNILGILSFCKRHGSLLKRVRWTKLNLGFLDVRPLSTACWVGSSQILWIHWYGRFEPVTPLHKSRFSKCWTCSYLLTILDSRSIDRLFSTT